MKRYIIEAILSTLLLISGVTASRLDPATDKTPTIVVSSIQRNNPSDIIYYRHLRRSAEQTGGLLVISKDKTGDVRVAGLLKVDFSYPEANGIKGSIKLTEESFLNFKEGKTRMFIFMENDLVRIAPINELILDK